MYEELGRAYAPVLNDKSQWKFDSLPYFKHQGWIDEPCWQEEVKGKKNPPQHQREQITCEYVCVATCVCVCVVFPHTNLWRARERAGAWTRARAEVGARICLLVRLFVCFADVGVGRGEGGGGGVGWWEGGWWLLMCKCASCWRAVNGEVWRKKRTRTQVLISRLSKAQYVIFLGTTFQSHSTSPATHTLGGNQTFWIAALG